MGENWKDRFWVRDIPEIGNGLEYMKTQIKKLEESDEPDYSDDDDDDDKRAAARANKRAERIRDANRGADSLEKGIETAKQRTWGNILGRIFSDE